MPIYEYVCEACGRIIEVMQRMSDPPPPGCPECGEGRLARLVSRTTFQLKGGGWYSDLYSSQKKKPEPGGEAGKSGGAPATSPAPTAAATTSPAPGGASSEKGSSGAGGASGSKGSGDGSGS